MSSKFKEIFDYKSIKVDVAKDKIQKSLNSELAKFNFEDDYLNEGNLDIISCSEILFHTCTIENFTDTRNISETNRPNMTGVQIGTKRFSEFNVWDYKLSYNKEFENSDDNHIIEESHHAIGCGTCKQHGKVRCSSCRGAGDLTCSSCSGRGENKCSSCSGRGETQCWSCSGKGTKETGYGDSKRYERCSSCSGRGYKPCSSCRNGYVTCSSCSGKGRVTCYTCYGSGEVTCYECEGYRTMDHYFIVNSKFLNLHQLLFLTNPYPGFDILKAMDLGFSIQNKLFEIKENRFKDGFFDQLQTHPLFRQICIFFDFQNSYKTRLISSRITFFENKYFEVKFSFYGENYIIYFDQNLNKSYYADKKPSDQYELDLLSKSLKSAIRNELGIAKKTIQKLSKYDFISINEKTIITAIEDTQNIYEAKTEIDNRNFNNAESTLKLVTSEKKSEEDYKALKKKLDKIYLNNTILFSLIGLSAVCLKLFNKNIEFVFSNLSIAVCIIFLCIFLNRFIRNINVARWLVVLLLSVQFSYIFYIDIVKGNEIRAEYLKVEEFDEFKKGKIIISIDNGDESLFSYINFPRGISGEAILLNEQQNVNDLNYYFVVKPGFVERWYRSEVKIPNLIVDKQRRVYSDNDLKQILSGVSDQNQQLILRDWEKRLEFYARVSDLYVIENIAVEFMFNDRESFEQKQTYTVYMPKFIYELLLQKKPISGYNLSNAPSISILESSLLNNINLSTSLSVGQSYQGGILVKIDESGQHGYVMSIEDLGKADWAKANELCDNYSYDGFADWSLPSIEELREIYSLKNQMSNFQENWYWSSSQDQSNSNFAIHLGFISGDEMPVPKEHLKFVRAIRKF
ncbi:MAG: DUF1566 domain-containing protein [Chitinophagia bacterium]|jgi:hypothetical protein